jgi:hypothetical protein
VLSGFVRNALIGREKIHQPVAVVAERKASVCTDFFGSIREAAPFRRCYGITAARSFRDRSRCSLASTLSIPTCSLFRIGGDRADLPASIFKYILGRRHSDTSI